MRFSAVRGCPREFLLSLALLLIVPTVSAKVIIKHEGNNNPAVEGWILENSIDDSPQNTGAVEGGAEVINGIQHLYWRVHDAVSAIGGIQHYFMLSPGVKLHEKSWVMQASVRVISSSPVVGRDIPGNSIMVSDGVTLWALGLGTGRIGFIGPAGTLYQQSLDLNSDYVSIRMQFNLNNPGIEDDTVDVYVNDELLIEGAVRTGLYSATTNQLLFGGSGQFGEGDAHYELVRLDDGNNAPRAVAGTSLDVNNSLQLDASLSSDADGDALSFSWLIEGEADPRTGMLVPIDDLGTGNYKVELTVSDGQVSSTDSLLFAVMQAVVEAPAIDLSVFIARVEALQDTIRGLTYMEHDDSEKSRRGGKKSHSHKHHEKWFNHIKQRLINKLDAVADNMHLNRCDKVVDQLQHFMRKLNKDHTRHNHHHGLADADALALAEEVTDLIEDIAAVCY